MIRSANLNDLNEIAKLHSESFADHFLPKLGLKLLANYYKKFIDNRNIFIVNITDKNEIDGLVLGTPSSAIGRNLFIKSNKIRLSLRILWLCLRFDKDTWTRVFGFIQSFLSKKNKDVITSSNNPNIKTLSLLSICVSQESKGKGVSKGLVKEFENRLIKHGYEGYTLTVHKMNNRANQFYKKMKMNIYKESGSEYGYVKQLS